MQRDKMERENRHLRGISEFFCFSHLQIICSSFISYCNLSIPILQCSCSGWVQMHLYTETWESLCTKRLDVCHSSRSEGSLTGTADSALAHGSGTCLRPAVVQCSERQESLCVPSCPTSISLFRLKASLGNLNDCRSTLWDLIPTSILWIG